MLCSSSLQTIPQILGFDWIIALRCIKPCIHLCCGCILMHECSISCVLMCG